MSIQQSAEPIATIFGVWKCAHAANRKFPLANGTFFYAGECPRHCPELKLRSGLSLTPITRVSWTACFIRCAAPLSVGRCALLSAFTVIITYYYALTQLFCGARSYRCFLKTKVKCTHKYSLEWSAFLGQLCRKYSDFCMSRL